MGSTYKSLNISSTFLVAFNHYFLTSDSYCYHLWLMKDILHLFPELSTRYWESSLLLGGGHMLAGIAASIRASNHSRCRGTVFSLDGVWLSLLKSKARCLGSLRQQLHYSGYMILPKGPCYENAMFRTRIGCAALL